MYRDLLAALDACRPGESNMDDPALGDVARRLEQDVEAQRLRERVAEADRRLQVALFAVEPPVGMSERLLTKLAAAAAAAPSAAARVEPGETSVVADAVSDAARVEVAPPHRTPIRRRAFIAGSLAATAAAVLVAINLWPTPADPWTADQVLEAAIGLYTRGARTPARPIGEHPSDYPPSRDLVTLPRATQWWWLDDALAESDAIVYEIELGRGGPRGWLVAFSPSGPVTGLPDGAPLVPATPTTQGVCAGAWREGDLVYVLVVEGGPNEYRLFLRSGGDVIVTEQRVNPRVQFSI